VKKRKNKWKKMEKYLNEFQSSVLYN